VKKFGTPREQQMLDASNQALDKCKEDAACYAGMLDEATPADAAKHKATKAVWMAAVYGNEKTRNDLLAKVDKTKDPAIRLSLVEAIDHLAPDGDEAAATKLEAIAQADLGGGNKPLMQANDALVKTALKLRARAAK
jgi:hypothetical protein